MRKYISAFILFIFMAVQIFASSAQAASGGRVATVTLVKGGVSIDVDATDAWVDAAEGVNLKEGSKVKTSYDGYVEIAFDTKKMNVVKLAEGSKFTIGEKSSSGQMAELSEGKLLALFKNMKKGSKFEVKTPSAICGVRGSGMGLEVFGFITNVFSFSGFVYSQGVGSDGDPRGSPQQIPNGQKSMVPMNQDPGAATNMTANEKASWQGKFGVTTEEGKKDSEKKKEKAKIKKTVADKEITEEPSEPEQTDASE
ncbi:MAG: FecR domain-containing protein [Candidatus Omnitrophota bacterium]